jgi:hypothetical protein
MAFLHSSGVQPGAALPFMTTGIPQTGELGITTTTTKTCKNAILFRHPASHWRRHISWSILKSLQIANGFITGICWISAGKETTLAKEAS